LIKEEGKSNTKLKINYYTENMFTTIQNVATAKWYPQGKATNYTSMGWITVKYTTAHNLMEMSTQLKDLRVVLGSGILVLGIWTFTFYI